MTGFELVTVRVRDADGAEGVGYTYTVGAGGAAVHALLGARPRRRCCSAATPSGSRSCGRRCGGRCTTAAAAAPQVLAHLGAWTSRCGTCKARRARPAALAAARRLRSARAVLRRRHRPRLPARRAAAPDRRQPGPRLPRDQDEGRAAARCARTSSACAPCATHLGAGFPLMVDANMRWSVGRGHPRRPRASQPFDPVWLEEPTIPDDVAGPRPHRARGRPADRGGREPPHALRVPRAHRRRRRDLPRARRHQLRRHHRLHEGRAPGRGVQPAGDLARRPRRHRAPAGRRARTAPTSKPTASASTATSPSRCASRTASPSRRTGRGTGSRSTGRDWRVSGRRVRIRPRHGNHLAKGHPNRHVGANHITRPLHDRQVSDSMLGNGAGVGRWRGVTCGNLAWRTASCGVGARRASGWTAWTRRSTGRPWRRSSPASTPAGTGMFTAPGMCPAANSSGVRTSSRTNPAPGQLLDIDLRMVAPQQPARHEARHVDRVFGRAVLRRVGQLHLLQVEDRHARLDRHGQHVDPLVHAGPAHGLRPQHLARRPGRTAASASSPRHRGSTRRGASGGRRPCGRAGSARRRAFSEAPVIAAVRSKTPHDGRPLRPPVAGRPARRCCRRRCGPGGWRVRPAAPASARPVTKSLTSMASPTA